MRKAVGGALTGLVVLFFLYTCVGPFLQKPTQEQEATVSPGADTSLKEPGMEAKTVPPHRSESKSGERRTELAVDVQRKASSEGQTEKNVDRPSSMSRRGGAEQLSPLPPKKIARPRIRGERGLGADPPPVLSLLSRSSRQKETDPGPLRISIPERLTLTATTQRSLPTSTINTPTAYGPRWKHVYAGVGYQNRIRYDEGRDGVATVGAGIGNPRRYVGLDVRLNILDTYTDFADDRSLSLKLHRQLPYRMAVAVGYENVWHTDGTDGGSSRYAVASKILLLRDQATKPFGSMILTLGVGTDRFLPEQRFARGEDGLNGFGSVALRVHPRLHAIANWTGQDLALGASLVPLEKWPIVVTPALMDVTGRAGDGARFSVSVSLNYDFGN